MSAPPKSRGEPIAGKHQLVEYIEQGNKPPAQWRIGTEHEKFVYRLETLRRMPMRSRGASVLCSTACTRYGWEPVLENGKVIALTGTDGNDQPRARRASSSCRARRSRTSTRPAPKRRRISTSARRSASELGLGFLGLGMWPTRRAASCR